ncbi:MAG: cytochrome c [Solirubrobacteraceae bacterium]
MIAALLFVVLFLALGIGVVFIALSGGPRGARERMQQQSRGRRGGRGGGLAVALVILAMGVAVPVAIAISNSSHDAHQAPGGVDLTAAEVKGRSVFAQKCSTCHTLSASNAVGRVGPNLDNLRPPKVLVLDAIKNGRARGQGQMPAGLLDGGDAQDVAAYIVASAGRG